MGAGAATDAAPAAAQTWSDEGAGAPGGHSTIESSCQTIGSHSDVTEDVPLDVAENCLGRMWRLVPFLALIKSGWLRTAAGHMSAVVVVVEREIVQQPR